MSIDTHILLRTPVSARQVMDALMADLGPDLGLERFGDDELASDVLSVDVTPWSEDDRDLIEGGFGTATVRVMLSPRTSDAGFDAAFRVLAALLRLVPGDACAQEQGGGPLGLLRLGGTVYVNPGQVRPEDLTGNGYLPERLVVGISPGLAASA